MKQDACTLFEMKMRVESASDATLLKAVLRPCLTFWEESVVTFEQEGRNTRRREIEFGIQSGTWSRAEVWSLIGVAPDCHVAHETVTYAANYTGRRVRPEFADTLPKAPGRERMGKVLASLERAREYLRLQLARTEQAAALMRNIAETGELPSPTFAGSFAPVRHAATGPMSIRRISDTSVGKKDPARDGIFLLEPQ